MTPLVEHLVEWAAAEFFPSYKYMGRWAFGATTLGTPIGIIGCIGRTRVVAAKRYARPLQAAIYGFLRLRAGLYSLYALPSTRQLVHLYRASTSSPCLQPRDMSEARGEKST